MDNGLGENFKLIFNGEGLPEVRSFNATGLVTGLPYKFFI